MGTILFIGIMWILPIYVGHQMAIKRNWSTGKALVATLFFGWFGVLGIALFVPEAK